MAGPLPLGIDEIRRHNPKLDDDQAHRAHLAPAAAAAAVVSSGLGYTEAQWDALVDSLTERGWKPPRGGRGGAAAAVVPRLRRRSRTKLDRRRVQPYTTDFTDDTYVKAARAGFFVFGSEFEFPGVPLARRSLLNLELCGEPTRTAGRLVLEGAARGPKIGKRALRGLRAAARAGIEYRLTVGRAFDEVVDRIVARHGVDWVGFAAIRGVMSRLASARPVDAAAGAAAFRMVSIELWAVDDAPLSSREEGEGEDGRGAATAAADGRPAASEPALVSGEIGYIVGSCYTCLSLFADEATHPRCSRLRLQAGHILLAKAGVTLFDAGTTAAYFESLHGYRRATRREFVDLWRRHRDRPLTNPGVLAGECRGLHDMLRERMAQARAAATTETGNRSAKRARPPAEDDRQPPGKRNLKGVGVRVSWPPGEANVQPEQVNQSILSHFAQCGSIRKLAAVQSTSAVVVFADGEAAGRAIALPPSSDPHAIPFVAEALTTRKKRRKENAA